MPKIMLVEDDNNLREIYGERLMAEGYEIVSANDGEEALALAVKEKPDLIISDVMMPKISGFDMLDILRQTPETKNTKVIIMTALSQAEDKNRASALGSDKYLVKSQVTLEDVARVVHDLLYGDSSDDESLADTTMPSPNPAASVNEAETPLVTPINPEPVIEPSAEEPLKIPPAQIFGAPQSNNEGPSFPTPAFQPVETPAPPAIGTTNTSSSTQVIESPVSSQQSVASTATTDVGASSDTPAPIPTTTPVEANFSTANPINQNPMPPFQDNIPTNPVVNPITGEAGSAEVTPTNFTSSATATSTSDEQADVAKKIREFVARPVAEEPEHVAPLIEPTEQDIIHAKNAAEEPEITKSELADEAKTSTDPNSSNTAGMKVIQPISDPSEQPADKLHQLYEAEIKKEAANTPVQNPTSGSLLQSPVSENPITASDSSSPAPLQTVDTTQIEGLTVGDAPVDQISSNSNTLPTDQNASASNNASGAEQIAL